MKPINIAIVLLAAASISSCAEDARNKPGWNIVWEEQFDQTDGFNTKIWRKIPRGTADWNNYMADFPELYDVKDGQLILRGINNTEHKEDTAQFLTGGVYTNDLKTFQDGRLEIKAKLQSATGAWPAFWLLPASRKGWPDGGEIDIMEHLNYDSIVYQTIHSVYTLKHGIKDNPQYSATGTINVDDYNVYTVEMHNDSLCFFINDRHTYTYPRIETELDGQFPFDAPFYLLLDMQLGGAWVGEVDPSELPVEMYIDWVRFYEKAE